jgi:hypothetical protein
MSDPKTTRRPGGDIRGNRCLPSTVRICGPGDRAQVISKGKELAKFKRG